MFAFDPCASRTSLIILDKTVSFPTAVASTRSKPSVLIVAPITFAPGPFSTGMLSPVTIDSSTQDWPSRTTPSTGIFSPGRTTSKSPAAISEIGASISLPSRITVATSGASSASFLIAAEVFPLLTASRYLPKRMSVIITPADSKYSSRA